MVLRAFHHRSIKRVSSILHFVHQRARELEAVHEATKCERGMSVGERKRGL